ncbi:MAG: TonB-dependent receptor, partial [Novosphingobium sp.]
MRMKHSLWLVSTAMALAAPPALAQTASADTAELPGGAIVVTGYRASLEQARDVKREATIIQDSIVASDIAAFPDLNLAEALQRLPGVAINREAGEGRRISLRGLGPDFTRVQLNGMEVLGNVDSPQDSRGQNSRDRAFDFNIFAAELFNRVDVKKSYSADQTEGGLAGTVGLYTARPFDYSGTKVALSAQGGTNTLTKDFQPRLTGLISKNWGDFGILISAAYSHRKTREEGVDTYRWRLNEPYDPATGKGGAYGSDISHLSQAEQDAILAGGLRFARGNRYSIWDSTQDRLGLTASIQWNPSDTVHLTLDGLYGQYKVDRFETHLASRASFGSTWLGGGVTDNGNISYPASTINAIHWNDQNEVDYLDVSNGNTATETRTQETKNTFKQLVFNGDAELTDKLKLTVLGGIERSSYDMPVSDKFYLEGFGDVVSDYRGGTYSLVNTYGWNTGDPANWHAKNINFGANYQDTAFDNLKGKFEYAFTPDDTLSFGGEWRRFKNSGYSLSNDNYYKAEFANGTVSADVSDYARTYTGFSGQDWVVVDYSKALSQLGLNRETLLGDPQSVFAIEERTAAGFVQYDWNHQLGNVPFRGNIGARYYSTDITSTGIANVGAVTADGHYDGILPAANLIFELNPDLLLRASAARNINRPSLGAMAINGSVSEENGEYSVSVGNPQLRPYKSTDLDLSLEYYFGKVGSVAAAVFYKTLDGFISTKTASNVPYSTTGLPTNLLPGLTADTTVTSFSRPINLGKTDLFGLELSVQSDFTFLPAPFDHFGTALNFTYVDSKFDYATIYGGGANTTLEGLSKYNGNATLYYEDAKFDMRVSANYRSGYVYSVAQITSAGGQDQYLSGFAPSVYVEMSAHYK